MHVLLVKQFLFVKQNNHSGMTTINKIREQKKNKFQALIQPLHMFVCVSKFTKP